MQELLPHTKRAPDSIPVSPVPPFPSAEDLRCFFENALGMLCIAGVDGYFKWLNPVWTTTLGWSLAELQSRPFLEFVHPLDRAATMVEMEKLTAGGRTVQFENRYRCKDDSYKWLEWNTNTVPGRDQVYAMACDITSSKGMEQEILEAGDREKERLGRELHDGLCQNLAGIAALSAAVARRLAAESHRQAGESAEISRLLNSLIGDARDMARGLNPLDLERIGIVAALESLSSNAEALFQVSCRFQCGAGEFSFAPEVEVHLYRIAQEALHNAITHGRARSIGISLSVREGVFRLSIQDDGIGIPDESVRREGCGMHTMVHRSRLIGGNLRLLRRSRRGTKVVCEFSQPATPPTP